MSLINELTQIVDEFGKDKGIDKDQIIEAIESAMLTAAKKKLGPHVDIEAHYNSELGEIEIFQFKTVVEDDDVADEDIEVELSEARAQDPEIELGDSIGIKLDSSLFGRIAAQTAKQVISQKTRDAEREIIYTEFLERKGEIISGIVRRIEKNTLVVDLGKTEAYMPQKEQIPGENYRLGDRVQAYLLDVRQNTKGPQIILSRATPQYLIKLFELEVPEIYEGIVSIKSAAREPGSRAKIAVSSKNPDVDPVGACVGLRGVRVQSIVQELKGERIDIVPYNEDIAKFVVSALAPAEISKVLIDDQSKYMEVIVPDNQLSLAIGRRGQNVKLAAQLTDWKIDVINESKMSERYEDAKFSITQIPGINETLATSLFQNGFHTVFDIADAKEEDIVGIPGFESSEQANSIILKAKELVDSGKAIIKSNDEDQFKVIAKKTADELLKEEMKKLIEKENKQGNTSELLKLKGVGSTFVELLNEKNIFSISDITKYSKEAFLNVIDWDKIALGIAYDSALISENERLINEGLKEKISNEEFEKIKNISGVGKSFALRLAAADFLNIDSIVAVSEDEFISKVQMDEARAKEFYNLIISHKLK